MDCSIHQNVGRIIADKTYCCWYWARGSGSLRNLFYQYGEKKNGKIGFIGTLPEDWKSVPITTKWRLYKRKVLFKSNVNSVAVSFLAKGKIEIDNISFCLNDNDSLLTTLVSIQTNWLSDLKQFVVSFREDQIFKEKFSVDIEKVNEGINKIINELNQNEDLPLEREFDLKQKGEEISLHIQELIEKIKFEEVLR